jgi:hypothetical protein
MVGELRFGHRLVWLEMLQSHQPGRVAERQRLEQHAVHRAERGDAGADAQRQRGQHREREAGRATHTAEREADVLDDGRHHEVLLLDVHA